MGVNATAVMLKMSGFCEEKDPLNDVLLQQLAITTPDGAQVYMGEADGREVYVYRDEHCDGNANTSARWVLGDKANFSVPFDHDQDGVCQYHARTLLAEGREDDRGPPMNASWRVFCGDTWKDLDVKLEEPQPAPSSFWLEGGCLSNSTVHFVRQTERRGAPVFVAELGEQKVFMYHDNDCDGPGPATRGRWVLDLNETNALKGIGEDGDNQCEYLARFFSEDLRGPPTFGSWRMYCDKSWRDVVLRLESKDRLSEQGLMLDAGALPLSGTIGAVLAVLVFALGE